MRVIDKQIYRKENCCLKRNLELKILKLYGMTEIRYDADECIKDMKLCIEKVVK